MIKSYQGDILKIYEAMKNEEEHALIMRKEEIEKKLPEIIELDKKMGKLSVELALIAFKSLSNKEQHIASIKEKITELRVKKAELLVSNGYSIDCLVHHYKCEKCKDTGFIGKDKCTCYKQLLIDIYYKNSDLRAMLELNNFDTFRLDTYSLKKENDDRESPRKNMEKNVSKSWAFINNFSDSSENLLFYGNSGTGKTFLSHCIAKELLDKGFLVVYRTAEELIQNLRQVRFENNNVLEDLLLNCDLLIIDDLGTEQINDFSKTELFNLLNRKLLKGKKMLVSTNYTIEGLSKTYSERITSRLFGNFNLCKFFGDDIRVKINLFKMKQQ
jgi:DNA replication protein DnaC